MNEILKIAWRNLWRNKRRTIITASSIFFALFFAITMRSFQLGSYDHMIRQVIESFSGYLQVQDTEYADDPSIDNAFNVSPDLLTSLRTDPNVAVVVPRIESFALASTGTLSKGVLVAGIDPEQEKDLSNPAQKLVRYRLSPESLERIKKLPGVSKPLLDILESMKGASFTSREILQADLSLKPADSALLDDLCRVCAVPGSYLNARDQGVLVSDRLSDYLNIGVGDTVVLMGQGYHGSSAAGAYPVRGIVKMPAPDLDNKLIYMSLEQASALFSLDGKLTSIAINLRNTERMKETQARVSLLLEKEETLVVKNWEELNPTLKQQIQGDNKGGVVFLFVLYIIIFFGMFGTVQMMLSERQREFGMMVSIGMKRGKLATILTAEMIFLGLIGSLTGMLASVPLIYMGYHYPIKLTGEMARMYMDYGFDPIMPMAWFDSYFYLQGGVVFFMVLTASYLPVRSILKLDAIKALRGQ